MPQINIPYALISQILELVITIVGDVKISEAKAWSDVQGNAEELRSEPDNNPQPPAA